MLRLILDVVLALLIYLIPGIIVLDWVGFRDLRGNNDLVIALALSMEIVPVNFILVGNIFPFQPGFFAWITLSVLRYRDINSRGKGTQPVYLVTRQVGQASPQAGIPVYQDQYVKIYH